MDNNFLFLCVLQVTLANDSIELYMREGKVLMDTKVSNRLFTSQQKLFLLFKHEEKKRKTK